MRFFLLSYDKFVHKLFREGSILNLPFQDAGCQLLPHINENTHEFFSLTF